VVFQRATGPRSAGLKNLHRCFDKVVERGEQALHFGLENLALDHSEISG
jgi:hypothetical protein